MATKLSIVNRIRKAVSGFTSLHYNALVIGGFLVIAAAYFYALPVAFAVPACLGTIIIYLTQQELKRRTMWETSLSFQMQHLAKKHDRMVDAMARITVIDKHATAEPTAPRRTQYNRNSRRYDQIVVDEDIIAEDAETRVAKMRTANVRYQATEPTEKRVLSSSKAKPEAARPGSVLRAKKPAPASDIFYSDSLLCEFIQTALNKKNFKVLSDAIVRLPERKGRLYSLSAEVEGYSGNFIPARRYIDAAKGGKLNHKINAALVDRAATLIVKGGKKAAFYIIHADEGALFSGAFMERLITFARAHRALAGHIIVAFSHADFEDMPPRGLQIMRSLRQLGFQFMVSDVRTLAPDLALMQSCGVKSIMMPAAYLLDQMKDSHSFRDAVKARRMIEGSGVRMVISGVDSDEDLKALQPLAPRHAQGAVFSKPVQRETPKIFRAA